MTNPVRRLLPRSLDPRQNSGEPTFADVLVEDPPGADDEDRTPHRERMPDGTISARYKPFRPRAAPPKPSPSFLADPGYAARAGYTPDTFRTATANFNAWQQRHSDSWHRTVNELVALGCLPEIQAARATMHRVDQVAGDAAKRAAEARAAAEQAETVLSEAITAAAETGSRLPDGGAVLAARQAVASAEIVAEHAAGLRPAAVQAAQRALGRIDWRQTLQAAEQLDGTADLVAWITAELNPPAGPRQDPLRWL